jgi:hypothetical protein
VTLSNYVNIAAGPLVVIVGVVIFAAGFTASFISKRLLNKRVTAA